MHDFRVLSPKLSALDKQVDLNGRFLVLISPKARRAKKPLARSASSKEDKMEKVDTAVAVFADHQAAETAVKQLAAAGFEMKNLSIVGQGYHTDEKVVGFYNAGDRIKFWGTRGAFWGGFWGLLLGGIFMITPIGPVVALGYLGAILIAGLENAVIVGGLSALGAALYSIGIPKNSVVEYEAALKADNFLVMAHGTQEEVARAKAILSTANPSRLDVHAGGKPIEPADQPVHGG